VNEGRRALNWRGIKRNIAEYFDGRTSISIDPTNGLRMRNYDTLKFQVDPTGSVFIGTDISAAATTNLAVFTGAQTYNTEAMGDGDLLLGDNTAGKGNLFWDKSAGTLTLRTGTTTHLSIQTDGDIFIGTDITAVATTQIAIFANAQTYNGETTIGAGDLLLGDNSANKANMYWDYSTGKLQFRGGTTMQCEIGTDGKLYAGAGVVSLDSDGLSIAISTAYASNRSVKFKDGSNTKVELWAYKDTNVGFERNVAVLSVAATTGYGGLLGLTCSAANTDVAMAYLAADNSSDQGLGIKEIRCISGGSSVGVWTSGPFNVGLDFTIITPAADGIQYAGDLHPYRNSTTYTGYVFVPLTTALSSTSYDGNDTVNVGTTSIDTSAVFSAPVGIKAALVQMAATWAAAAEASTLSLRPLGGSVNACGVRAQTTFAQAATAIVPCDANGDFDVVVANANATNVVIRLWGYWI
jgi:hypothetical protein